MYFFKDYPLQPVGKFTLNKNPENYFAEVEQAAFSPSHIVPGVDVSADRMLQGRLFSYPDTHRHRLGVNYKQIPVNRPLNVANHQRDGGMVVDGNQGRALNYEPNSYSGPTQNNLASTTFSPEEIEGLTGRFTYELTDDDFVQPGNLYRLMSEENKTDLINNIAGALSNADEHIRTLQIQHFKRADPEYGSRVEEAIAKLLG
jgi:catalase